MADHRISLTEPPYCRSNTAPMVECASGLVPFTRASSAGLAGRRTAACLRSVATSSAGPRQTEQRSEPAGPRSRVPGGLLRGAGQAVPLGSPGKAKNEDRGNSANSSATRIISSQLQHYPCPPRTAEQRPPTDAFISKLSVEPPPTKKPPEGGFFVQLKPLSYAASPDGSGSEPVPATARVRRTCSTGT